MSSPNQRSSTATNFMYIINFNGVTHVLRASDKKAAEYLDLARNVENDLTTARNLFTEKEPFLPAEKQERMQECISDVAFAMKRTVRLLSPACVEQVTDESIKFNTKNAWVLQSDDPKAAATFGRLQIVHTKLKTLIYDLEHTQVAAQLESPDMPASSRRHSQISSATHMSASQTETWRRQHNTRSVASVSTLNLTPAPGDALDKPFAQSYSSAISNERTRSVSDPSTQLDREISEEPGAISPPPTTEEIVSERASASLPVIPETDSATGTSPPPTQIPPTANIVPAHAASRPDDVHRTESNQDSSINTNQPSDIPSSNKVVETSTLKNNTTSSDSRTDSRSKRVAQMKHKSYAEFRKNVQALREQQQDQKSEVQSPVGVSTLSSVPDSNRDSPLDDENTAMQPTSSQKQPTNVASTQQENSTPKVQLPYPDEVPVTMYTSQLNPTPEPLKRPAPDMISRSPVSPNRSSSSLDGVTVQSSTTPNSSFVPAVVGSPTDVSATPSSPDQQSIHESSTETTSAGTDHSFNSREADIPALLRAALPRSETMPDVQASAVKPIPPYPVSETDSDLEERARFSTVGTNEVRLPSFQESARSTPRPQTRSTYPPPQMAKSGANGAYQQTVFKAQEVDQSGNVPQICVTMPSMSVSRKPVPVRGATAPVSESTTSSIAESAHEDSTLQRDTDIIPSRDKSTISPNPENAQQTPRALVTIPAQQITADGVQTRMTPVLEPAPATFQAARTPDSFDMMQQPRFVLPPVSEEIASNKYSSEDVQPLQPRSSRFRDSDMNRFPVDSADKSAVTASPIPSSVQAVSHAEFWKAQNLVNRTPPYDPQARFFEHGPIRRISPVPQQITHSQTQLRTSPQNEGSGDFAYVRPQVVQTLPSPIPQDLQQNIARVQSIVPIPAGTVPVIMHRPTSSSQSVPTLRSIAAPANHRSASSAYQSQDHKSLIYTNPVGVSNAATATSGSSLSQSPVNSMNASVNPVRTLHPVLPAEQFMQHAIQAHPSSIQPASLIQQRTSFNGNTNANHIAYLQHGHPSPIAVQRHASPAPPPKIPLSVSVSTAASDSQPQTPQTATPARTTTTTTSASSHSSHPSIFSPLLTQTSSLDLSFSTDPTLMSGARSVRTSTILSDTPSEQTPGAVQTLPSRSATPVNDEEKEKKGGKFKGSWMKVKNARNAWKSLELRAGMDKDRGGAKIIKMSGADEQ